MMRDQWGTENLACYLLSDPESFSVPHMANGDAPDGLHWCHL